MTSISTQQQWSILHSLWKDNPTLYTKPLHLIPGIEVFEQFNNDTLFQYKRHFNGKRYTEVDLFGIVGTSLTNLQNKKLYLTEGVSDFLTVKALYPNRNVWGKTRLSLSTLQTHIIAQLFTEVVIIADNDSTGLKKASEIDQKLRSTSLQTKIYIPRYKDITLQLLNEKGLI